MALRFFFCAFVALALSLSATAQTASGVIKAAKVTGQVTKESKDGHSEVLKNGAVLTESDTVVTGKASSVVLVFMNGSSVKLAPETKLAIETFKMDPLADDIKVAELQKEPSVSKTQLNLSYGEIVGNVKTLNKEGGSTYSINTPVGAAGIRGTTFRIVFRPTGDGKAFNFQLSTAEGQVLFTGTTAGSGQVNVPNGQELAVEFAVDASGNVTITSVNGLAGTSLKTAPISNDASSDIKTTVEQSFKEAQQQTSFSCYRTAVRFRQRTARRGTAASHADRAASNPDEWRRQVLIAPFPFARRFRAGCFVSPFNPFAECNRFAPWPRSRLSPTGDCCYCRSRCSGLMPLIRATCDSSRIGCWTIASRFGARSRRHCGLSMSTSIPDRWKNLAITPGRVRCLRRSARR